MKRILDMEYYTSKLGMMAHMRNPCAQVDLYEFKARLVYKVNFRPDKATQQDPVSDK